MTKAKLPTLVEQTTPLEHPPAPRTGSPLRKRDVYLSIELDFWEHGRVDVKLLRRVLETLGPANIVACIDHDSVLRHTRRYSAKCRELINLDAHSDIYGRQPTGDPWEDGNERRQGIDRRRPLCPGSWVDYVPWP